ncbi:MAG: FAD-binding oxidoreductase [Thermaceae bacterium]|nr:FAD-binding oxidoreductase [Thermaceae bacterium]
MSRLDAEIVILGAGIAGLTLARVLHDAGHQVLVVAERLGEASTVPVALLNPVRGKRGRVAPEAEEALQALWDFYPRFTEVHRGILRPVPEEDRADWQEKLYRRDIPHGWTEEGLHLENAGWLETINLLPRLAQGLRLEYRKIASLTGKSLYTEDGAEISAECLIYAGGASGAHLVGLGGRFTPGSVLITRERFEGAKSYGVYVAGNSLGGSYLPHLPTYSPHQTQDSEVEWLLSGAKKLLGYRPEVVSSWAGVRYRLDQNYLREIPAGWALTGFGSAAFFYAPLYALRLLERLG